MCISSVWAPETVGATKWGAGLCDATVQALAFPARGLGRAPRTCLGRRWQRCKVPAGPQAPSLSTKQGSIFSGKRGGGWSVNPRNFSFRTWLGLHETLTVGSAHSVVFWVPVSWDSSINPRFLKVQVISCSESCEDAFADTRFWELFQVGAPSTFL